ELVLASIADLKDRVRKPRPVDDDLQVAMKGVAERVGRLEGELAGASQQLGHQGAGHASALAELGDRLSSLQTAVGSFRDDVATDLQDLPTRLHAPVRLALEDTAARVDGVQSAVDLLGQRLGQSGAE